ncbi:MAG TPA: cytochrome c [Blastocatellia bacterium]|nr:cytochrome c [Blastocatellia bacterium]
MRRKKLFLAVVVSAVVLSLYAAAQSGAVTVGRSDEQGRKQIPEGRELYMNYCASCHGPEARGNGQVTPALKKRPADLTRIRKRDGRFPAEHIKKIITGETVLPVHGEREMPVWGSVLKEPELTSLVKYLESIQRFPDLYPN